MTDDLQSINCTFSDENSLHLAYMPFIKGGGLFVRTKKNYQMGSTITLSVKLLDEPEIYTVEGKIVWVTPKGAQGNKPCGVGIQFTGDDSGNLRNKIETCLAGMLKSTQTTDTI